MTKTEILAELVRVDALINNHVRGSGSLTALKAYQRKMYRAYVNAA